MKKDYFNFERTDGLGDDTITSCTLLFNNQRREKPRDPLFWSTIQSDLYYPKTIGNGLYMYSFAIDAAKWFPTGSCNFSRMDEVAFDLTLPTVDAHGKQFGRASVTVIQAHHNVSCYKCTQILVLYVLLDFLILYIFLFLQVIRFQGGTAIRYWNFNAIFTCFCHLLIYILLLLLQEIHLKRRDFGDTFRSWYANNKCFFCFIFRLIKFYQKTKNSKTEKYIIMINHFYEYS
jgi:hypothetical protein